jgi:hypothetical protein
MKWTHFGKITSRTNYHLPTAIQSTLEIAQWTHGRHQMAKSNYFLQTTRKEITGKTSKMLVSDVTDHYDQNWQDEKDDIAFLDATVLWHHLVSVVRNPGGEQLVLHDKLVQCAVRQCVKWTIFLWHIQVWILFFYSNQLFVLLSVVNSVDSSNALVSKFNTFTDITHRSRLHQHIYFKFIQSFCK